MTPDVATARGGKERICVWVGGGGIGRSVYSIRGAAAFGADFWSDKSGWLTRKEGRGY